MTLFHPPGHLTAIQGRNGYAQFVEEENRGPAMQAWYLLAQSQTDGQR
jgi:hypothetical protein